MSSAPGAAPAVIVDETSPGTSGPQVRFNFSNTYARLPDRFFARCSSTSAIAPRLLQLNEALALKLNLEPDALASTEGVRIFAGDLVPEGAEPLAQAYAGHQFGHFVPQLGDGRAILLGEVVSREGQRYDIQLKGSGPTPFSRRGDGRAAMGPVLREYLVSEAMTALGIPSTRALAAVATGDQVLREAVLPGAVLTRVAASHLRVGSFEYFAARSDLEALRTLAKYALDRHYPEAAKASRPMLGLLQGLISRQAYLVAQWMLVGFVHGVMNTDNTSISGETIDFGPCAFMEAYDPATVFSSIDVNGRYAYSNQPHAMLWNLTRFAETLLPLLEAETGSEEAALTVARTALEAFGPQYEAAHLRGLRRKLGLTTEQPEDQALADDLLGRMAAQHVDFTLGFRRLCDAVGGPEGDSRVRELFADPSVFNEWAVQWRQRLQAEHGDPAARADAMRQANPAFIPRNHKVQQALDAAIKRGDLDPFRELLDVVTNPYQEQYQDQQNREAYASPAKPEECVTQTFCGT